MSEFKVTTENQWGDDCYFIALPHQCDQWVITESDDKAEAIAEMEAFIEAADKALSELKALLDVSE